jgi:peptide/nickel transport system permease protein
VRYLLRKTAHSFLLVIGVTFVSFVLMVQFGPDQTYSLLGKNPSADQIREVRHQLGYDQPFFKRYADYVADLATLRLGASDSSGEAVSDILKRTVPISLALVVPGFLIGNLLGIALGLLASHRRGLFTDRLIMTLSVTGMSISFLIVIIVLQLLLCTPYGLNLFPVRGWQVDSLGSYLAHVTVPTLSMVMVTLGYNTKFYRAVFVEESGKDHIRTARAYGASPANLMWRHVLKNSMVPVSTRVMFSIPLVVISGSLLIESYFGIPGIGKATFDAITSGDQPVLKAVVGLTAVAFVLIQLMTDMIYKLVDPRVA